MNAQKISGNSRRRGRALVFAAAALLAASAVSAQSIIDDWANIKAQPPPELKPVTIDPKTTALLMLDFVTPNCTNRPRCMVQLPAVKQLLETARETGMAVAFATGPTGTNVNDFRAILVR